MADKAEGAKAAGASGQRQQLHVAYGNALISARGYRAPETTEAFAKARDAVGEGGPSERLAADFGLWIGSYLRGELDRMRALAATFLADASAVPNSPEAGVAERIMANTHWYAGSFRKSRAHHERAIALFKPGRDDDLAFRFGYDPGVGAMAAAAMSFWVLGEVDRAVDLMNQAEARYAGLAHAATRAAGNLLAAIFYLMRGDRRRAATHGAELADLARQHDLQMWHAFAAFFDWGAEPYDTALVLEGMRRGLELLRAQNVCLFDGVLKGALAEEEAEAGNFAGAIELLDNALASSARTGQRMYDAQLHRLRGEMLLRRCPGDPKPAQEALNTAIAVACDQGARSFQLRAALSLAELYQSTGCPAEAHAVLAPGARRLLADPGNARDRGSAGAARGAGGDGRGQGVRSAAAAATSSADRLWKRADWGARDGRAGSEGSLRQSRRVRGGRRGRAGAAGDPLRPVGSQLAARRAFGDEGVLGRRF